jgi:putative aldouronate transport system permease protein
MAKMHETASDKVFQIINNLLLAAVLVVMIYPLYFTIIASISNPHQVALGNVIFLPKGFTTDVYKRIFEYDLLWIGYRNTLLYTVFGSLWNLILTIPCGYALTKRGLKGRGIIMGLFVFTMYFGGGMVPSYLLIKNLGLINHPLVMILPGGVSVWNLIVTRTSLMNSIPDELVDAAKIDGAGEFRMFGQIVLPLSKAVIAVMALFYTVGHWNSFFNALLYINNRNLYPLQLVLRSILIMNQQINIDMIGMDTEEIILAIQRANLVEAMKYGIVFIASVPVLVAYPFVQKYFVKGVMIGSLKG